MNARTLWKGVIHMEKHRVPVRLYAAVQDHTVHFRLLHKKDREPVMQRMVNSKTGEEVPKEDRRKGAEIDPRRFVLLNEEDLETLEPEPSRSIDIHRFVPRNVLNHEWYNRPYLLAPDGDGDDYWALAQAIEESGQEGIARWVMRNKEYVGALLTHKGFLSLTTLRFADEVVEPQEITGFASGEIDPRELKMAEQLVSLLESDFDPARYRDEHRDRIIEMLETKAKGGKVKSKKPSAKRDTTSLSNALKASLAAAKRSGMNRSA